MDKLELLRSERSRLIQRLDEIDAVLRQHCELERRISALLTAEVQDVATLRVGSSNSGGGDLPLGESANVRRVMDKPDVAVSDSRRSVSESVREFEALVADVLRSADKPLDRKQILILLGNRGYDVPGKDPENTLGARMTRMPGVVNVKGGETRGYWLQSRMAELGGVFE